MRRLHQTGWNCGGAVSTDACLLPQCPDDPRQNLGKLTSCFLGAPGIFIGIQGMGPSFHDNLHLRRCISCLMQQLFMYVSSTMYMDGGARGGKATTMASELIQGYLKSLHCWC